MSTNDKGENNKSNDKYHVMVIVLGDVGRSPRMQYHAASLLQHGHIVSLVGYTGESLIPELQTPANNTKNQLKVIRFEPYRPHFVRLKPLYLLLRFVGLVHGLCHALFMQQQHQVPKCVLVQNPPSIPLLFIAYLYCRYHGAGLVIDWHNLGYTMFDDNTPSIIRKIAKWYELKMAPFANGHLCVTLAMKQWLIANCCIPDDTDITVVRDCPPQFFGPTPLKVQHELLQRIPLLSTTASTKQSTLLTTMTCNGTIISNVNRPAFIVSSTSWTPDEDFSILLEALVQLNQLMLTTSTKTTTRFSRVVVVVTGKGPQKQMYETKIKSLNLQYISILTMWLEASDYPLLIGCADLGVSLHTSTSGLDLPMKVLDFLGSNVPVCAVAYPCLQELVHDGINGRIFYTGNELARQLFDLLLLPNNNTLEQMKHNIRDMTRWNENWDEHAQPVILKACRRTKVLAVSSLKKLN